MKQENKNWSLNDRSIREQATENTNPDKGLGSDATETVGSEYRDPQQQHPQDA